MTMMNPPALLKTTLTPLALAAALLAGCANTPAPDAAPATTPGAAPVATAASASASSAPITLRVIAFNDFHGNLEAGKLSMNLADPARPGNTVRVPVGGVANLAGTVAALRQGARYSAVVSSGDAVGAAPLVSALFRHESTIETLNQLGVDVATVGNHEFDAGHAELQRLLAGGCGANAPDAPLVSCALNPNYGGAKFPVVAANVHNASGLVFAPSWVQSYGGVKVGFIGAVTRTTPSIVVPSGIVGLRFSDEAEAINRSAQALLAQGVKALVAVVHDGGEVGSAQAPVDWNDSSCPQFRGDIVDIAQRITPQVDVILSAHTHQGYNCRVDGRPVMQATAYGRGVSVVDLVIDPATGQVDRQRTRARNLPVLDAGVDPALREKLAAAEPAPWGNALRQAGSDAAVAQIVAKYSAAAQPRAQRPVGRIGGSFDRKGTTDSAAGRLIADAQWAATRAPERGGAQLALMNPGGVRSDLFCRGTPPCVVTYGDAFTMQPFGNSLVVMTLTGAELRALLEQQQPASRNAPQFLAPSASLSYRWVASAPAGQRVQALRLNGQAITPEQNLRVTVNSFMADGGDGFRVLRNGRNRLGGELDMDALVAFLQTSPVPSAQARIEWTD
jgi:5'-nucleotidase